MPTIARQAIVPFSCQQMFDLVNDIEQYPNFLPWCPKAQVIAREPQEIQATVHFSKGSFTQSFTTVNRLVAPELIEMRLLEGPFRLLEGNWEFIPLASQGSEVKLTMSFEFSNKLVGFAIGPMFSQMASDLVQVFCQRAQQVYAKESIA